MLPIRSSVESFIQIVDAALASATARSGPHLVCYQMLHRRLIHPHEDAVRLREGLARRVNIP